MGNDKVKKNNTLRLKKSFGDGDGKLPKDSELKILDVVNAGTPGVGSTTTERRVLVSYQQPSPVIQDDGSVVEGYVERIISVSVEDLNGLTV